MIQDNELYPLFTQDIPLIDVRAPVEFEQGSFPYAYNIPLLNDQQRHEIGLKYKNEGQDKAIELGIKLISGDIKQQRIDAWKEFINANPKAKLYCFRGGLRSRTTLAWLKEHDCDIELIPGGYKRMRRYLIDTLEIWADRITPTNLNSENKTSQEKQNLQPSESLPILLLAGKTGTGKTDLLLKTQSLKTSDKAIDLEGIANHRGSSFGHYVSPQPAQIDFENKLAIEYLKAYQQNYKRILLEDEGRLIGKAVIPEPLYKKMKQSPLILLERPLDERVEITLNDYIISNYHDFIATHGEEGRALFKTYLLESLSRIQKRLGGTNYKKLSILMTQALEEQFEHNELNLHRQWIKALMQDYYDPMYDYQLEKKQDRLLFRGNEAEIRSWLKYNAL